VQDQDDLEINTQSGLRPVEEGGNYGILNNEVTVGENFEVQLKMKNPKTVCSIKPIVGTDSLVSPMKKGANDFDRLNAQDPP
jgi:hypothetical protein